MTCTHREPVHYEVWDFKLLACLACFGTEQQAEDWLRHQKPKPRRWDILEWRDDAQMSKTV